MDISIITPTFNREDCIIRCLESITKQLDMLNEDIKIEHIVVDDGSHDSTPLILKEYADSHQHVKPIYFNQNKGVNAARNEAIRQARYKWCLFLDSDDYLTDSALNDIVLTVKSNPGYRSYMFTVDDRIADMAQLGKRRELTFEDFLLGRVAGDFAHLLDRQLLINHPFNEELRIYEGIFFLYIYKDIKKMLFSNIVTHRRERDRDDSVTLTSVRYNDTIIHRKLIGAKLQLDWFTNDYINKKRLDLVDNLKFQIADNAVLLGDYKTAHEYLNNSNRSFKFIVLRTISTLRLGALYKKALQLYLSVKHNRPQRGVC